MRTSSCLCAAALIATAHASAAPESYPVRPIRMILGYAPGTTPDVVGRILSERVAQELGQLIIIDNRPGAGGTLAVDLARRSTPDGYTLLVDGCSAAGMVYAFVMTGRPPFDPFKDFTPVGRLMRDHWLITASPQLRIGSLAELVALGKSKPGSLTFPSSGVGTSQHLQSERFRMRVGIEAMHVPYRQSFVPDLMAGRVSFAVQSSAAAVPLVKTGKLKGLAVLSVARLGALPEVPTSAEAGLPDLLYNAGICLYAPGGSPRSAIMRLNQALNAAHASETVKQRFEEHGVETVQATVEETARFITELMALVDQLRTAVFGRAR
jgi:tripartite-type tricarboxylate transporter receptor subunit TctC